MRFALLLCYLLISDIIFSQKMLRSDEWCAAGRNLLAAPPPSSPDTRSDSLDITHTFIEMNVANAPQISARCVISFTAKMDDVKQIQLDLQGLAVDSVALNGSTFFTHIGTALTIPFVFPLDSGSNSFVEIYYHGQPVGDASGWGGVYSQSGYFFNLGVGFAADPHNFGRAWFPCFDNFVERCTFDFLIVSKPNQKTYCNGELISENEENGVLTRSWKIEQPIPSYLACFAAGPYVSWKRTYDSIPVEIAAAAADTNKVRNTFQHLPEAVACYKYWFGPYLWPKIGYSLVPFSGGAMEHATNVAIGQPFIDGSLTYETLWAHELSHHWWGDLATCSTAEDMWLNEGWAVYSEHLFTEWVYGRTEYLDAVRSNFLNVLEGTHVAEGGYRAVSGLPHDLTYGEHVYNKGAIIGHNLRSYLGDTLFRAGIQTALAQTNFDDWSSAELRDKLSSATGQDLTDFFNDWVFAPGFSHFSVDSFSTEIPPIDTFLICSVFVKQKLRGAPHFYQNVPLEFTFVDENWQRQTRTAVVGGENSTAVFYFPYPASAPKFVWLNTDWKLTLARTDRELVLKTTGSKNFTPAKMTMNVSALPDSALVRVEHHYAMPDVHGEANPNGYLLTNRYWTVEADFPAGFVGSAGIFYDGRGQLDQLDTELFAQTSSSEDTILLLYRPAPGFPWTEYATYFHNKLTSPTDKYGYIRIDNVQPGQYTVAKGVSTVSAGEPPTAVAFARATPNPADSVVRLQAEEPFDKILIFNEKGQILREWETAPTTELEVQMGNYPTGRYWFVLFTDKGAVSCSAVIVR
jgi:aminopeptidase N